MTNDGVTVPLADRHFEDYTAGTTAQYGAIPVTEDSIIQIASAFDPQHMHTNPDAAKGGPL